MKMGRITIAAMLAGLLIGGFVHRSRADSTFSDPVSVLDDLTRKARSTVTQTTDDGVQISAGNTKREVLVRTTAKYKTPLVITARVKTDSSNIRLYFGARLRIILNWELNQHELRFRSPSGDDVGKPDAGYVAPDTWVDIRWTIDTDKTTIDVNGVQRASFDGDFSRADGSPGVGTNDGAVVTVQSLEVAVGAGTRPPAPNPGRTPAADAPVDVQMQQSEGPTTRISRTQSEIHALYVVEDESGEIGGVASELILTADPGEPTGKNIPVSFTTRVGPEMRMVLDDVIRTITTKYARIAGTSKLELSFEDKYTPKDGGSIGAAIGTLILSSIENFQVDPQLAMTGDVSADGKIRKIGGVAAKLRGAADAGCTIVALPMENTEQLLDAMIFNGPGLITDVQVIGITDLDNAASVARTDRDEKLARAISIFDQVQASVKDSPRYLQTAAGQARLQEVLELAPQHLSARLLLGALHNAQRRHLTATASIYYTLLAAHDALPSLVDQARAGTRTALVPAAVQSGLAGLRKVRPLADPKIQPFVDAWTEFIQAWSQAESGMGTYEMAESKRQALLNEMGRLDTNKELAQKMLQEGI